MEEIALPKLRVSRKEAKDKIQAQIEKGELLRDRQNVQKMNWTKAYRSQQLVKIQQGPFDKAI